MPTVDSLLPWVMVGLMIAAILLVVCLLIPMGLTIWLDFIRQLKKKD